MTTITLRIKVRGEGLEGNQIRPGKLQEAIKAASITVQNIQHLDPDLLIDCEPADEAAIRALITAHLATDWAALDARDRIDAAANAARSRYIPHQSVVPEYLQAEREAQAFKDSGYTGNAPPMVAAWAQAKGWTATQAANDILAAAANLRGLMSTIRAIRLQGKEGVAAGTTTLEAVVAALDAI